MYIPKPGAEPPSNFRLRSLSFAAEFYGLYRRVHAMMVAVFLWGFPCPITATAKTMRRAGFAPVPTIRGETVSGSPGTGRFVGRHPVSGKPIIAWDMEEYKAICEAFDKENAHSLAAWRAMGRRLFWSSKDCAQWSRRSDQSIRILFGLGVGIPPLVGLIFGAPVELFNMVVLSTLFTLLLISMGMFLVVFLFVPVCTVASLTVGIRAIRRDNHARERDDAMRSSAADLLSQHTRPLHQTEKR